MKAINKATLVKSVYALVEDGWQDAPSEHLKYPIMQLVGDTFYYNRGALASALAYAKQENESAVISKVEKLYKKFKLNEDEGGEGKDMADIKKKMSDEELLENEKKCEDTEVMQYDVEMSENSEKMATDNQEDMCGDKMEDDEAFADDDKEVDKADENDEPDDKNPEGSDEDAEDFSDDKSCATEDEVMEDVEEEILLDEASPEQEETPVQEEKPQYHKIRPGDTLTGLARRNGVTVRQLCEWNGLTTKSTLRVGRSIRVK